MKPYARTGNEWTSYSDTDLLSCFLASRFQVRIMMCDVICVPFVFATAMYSLRIHVVICNHYISWCSHGVFVVCSWCICHVLLHACAPYGKIQGNALGKLSYLCRRVHTNGHVNWAADHIATCSHSKLIFLFLFQHLYILPVVGYHGITLTKDLCLALWRYSFPFHPLLGRQQDRRAKGLVPTKSNSTCRVIVLSSLQLWYMQRLRRHVFLSQKT